MSDMSAYKITYCWLPRRLAQHELTVGFRFIGWVWLTKALLVHNSNYGWIAFLDDQTKEKMETCPYCKRRLT